MKKYLILSLSALIASANLYGASFNPEQTKEIEAIIKDYLVTNPEVLMEAAQALQKKQMESMQAEVKKMISKETKSLFNSNSPTLGAKNGKVKIVEFLDYQCGHCKQMHDAVNNLIQNNSDLQVTFKLFPIFGPDSAFAAKAALAAQKQGRFKDLHNALLNEKAPLTNDKVIEIASSVGLNTEQLKQDMQSFNQELQETNRLAVELGIRGTPAFIIAPSNLTETSETIYLPGAVGERTLQEAIKKVQN